MRRVAVVDDHPMFREGLAALLAAMEETMVVGQAGDGAQALALVAQTLPDVVLMDLHMPVLNGVEATRRITADYPDVAVLVLTMLTDDESLFAALRAGARGYLLKESSRDDILRALEAVASGQAVLDPQVAPRVLGALAPSAAMPDPAAFPHLTEREREILDLIARGLTNPAIAERLTLSEKTVRNHVSNVFAKIHVTDRAGAVARARDAGYGGHPGGLSS
jgi:DNA-binding NarL/FixJ family response regulator